MTQELNDLKILLCKRELQLEEATIQVELGLKQFDVTTNRLKQEISRLQNELENQ